MYTEHMSTDGGQMLFRTALGKVLRELRLEQQKTLRQISERGFISLGYLSEIENGQKELSSEPLNKLAVALNTTASAIVVEAGYRMDNYVEPFIQASKVSELVSPSF
jgi:transcriptional regulator with XRE-family HTH domain